MESVLKKAEEQKFKEVSVELKESVVKRLNDLGIQQQHIQTMAEATMITVFEQAGIEVPLGVQMELKGNKLTFKTHDV